MKTTTESLDVPSIRVPDFSSETTLAAGAVRIKLTGNADVVAIEPLSTLLPKLHAEATRNGVDHVIVDLLELEFMNSSCFKSFVTWISTLQGAEKQYRITFFSNPAMLWQRRSLHALSCFAADLVTVETSPS